ncbi:MAG TPA: hypothetical protein VL221_04100 [Bacteroidota bacterium]|nr:hypothetical protein [Bacteroidota bacterium]
MKPIWYFVGLFLTAVGVIVLASGLYDLATPPAEKTVLAELHPGVWWGAVILVAGLLFFLLNRKKTVE